MNSVILLDALGTLIELEPPAPRLRAEICQRYGVALSELDAERAIGAEIAYYRRHLDEGRDAESLASLRSRCAAALRGGLPGDVQRQLPPAAELVEPLLASLRFRAYADAEPALAAWRHEGARVVVVSNWDVSLHDVLDRVGVLGLLDGVVTAAEAGARKPAPAIFERALGLLGASPDAALHIGDSLEEDVAGARAAGIEPILISRDGTPGPAGVRTVDSLNELRG